MQKDLKLSEKERLNKRLIFAKEQREKYPEPPFIHPTAIVPEWVKIGKNARIHEYCTIGTQGFGFAREKDGSWIHIPHVGGVVIGDNVEIFPHSNIDRGTIDNTIIGDGTKIDHYCHIGHNSRIGKNCIITAGVIIGGSAIIGDDVWIGPHSWIMNKMVVANGVYIGSHTNVIKSIEKPNVKVVGNPARIISEFKW